LAIGLVALLDDVAGIAKLAASSLDDVGAAAGKASSKAAGVVIDDAAVTPRYVVGLTPDRELPIIAKIAKGSLRNKLVILLPIALLLSALAPWALTPCLMVGGAYLCFEGAEKIFEAIWEHHDHEAEAVATLNSAELEKQKVSGAIRTDFILSGEIMAISLASVADQPLVEQAIVLAVVAVLITVGVYGVVGLIVKMDDIGLRIARGASPIARAIGGGLVRTMPVLMRALSIIGTAAMLWVGGGIIVHGLEAFGLNGLPHLIHHAAESAAGAVPSIGAVAAWGVNALGAGIVGLVVGAVLTALILTIGRLRSRGHA
jgi:predicted DNA repair protein MutK